MHNYFIIGRTVQVDEKAKWHEMEVMRQNAEGKQTSIKKVNENMPGNNGILNSSRTLSSVGNQLQ